MKLSISTASLAPSLGALSVPCLPMGTAVAAAWSLMDLFVSSQTPHLAPIQNKAIYLSQLWPWAL